MIIYDNLWWIYDNCWCIYECSHWLRDARQNTWHANRCGVPSALMLRDAGDAILFVLFVADGLLLFMRRMNPVQCRVRLDYAMVRSVFIISNRKISNWASQIPKANTLLMCPYCLKFQIARVWAAKTNMKLWKLTVWFGMVWTVSGIRIRDLLSLTTVIYCY